MSFTQEIAAGEKKRSARRRHRVKKTKVTCAVCHQTFKKMTPTHLQTHGMTTSQYQRVFMADTASPTPPRVGGRPPALEADPPPPLSFGLVQRTAEELVTNDAFVSALADEASELLFSTHFRERLQVSLAQLLNQRLVVHAQAVSHLKTIREELSQPWRTTSGGPDGEPTPTPHLVAMAGEAHHEMVKAEDALFRTTRLLLEEQKQRGVLGAALNTRMGFTGEGEAIPVPPELDAGERETVRSLVHMLQREVQLRAERRRTIIDAQVQETLTREEGAPTTLAPEPDEDSDRFAPLEPPLAPLDDFPLG